MPSLVNRWTTILALVAGLAMAVVPASLKAAEVLETALEQRVIHLTEELRCLVCQNQTIADSHAELAIDLRNQVREKLLQGMSDAEVLNYMVARYGDFVLYRPPVKNITWALWFGPFLLLFAGLGLLFSKLRHHDDEPEVIDQAQLARASVLLFGTEALKEKP